MSAKQKREFSYQAYPTTPWWHVWWRSVVRPSVTTFEHLNDDPNAQKDKVYGWVFWAGMLATLLWLAIQGARGSMWGTWYMCFVPLGGVLPGLLFWMGSWLTQMMAGFLGGLGNQRDFRYLYSGIFATLTLFNLVLTAATWSSSLIVINAALLIYQGMVTAMALKAINRFGWFSAIFATVCQLALNAALLYGLLWVLYRWWVTA